MRHYRHKSGQLLSRLLTMITWVASATLISSCAVGPDYRSQQAPKGSNYTAGPMPVETAAAPVALGASQHFVSANIAADWWKVFGSTKLNTLIEQAHSSSPTLAAARATLEQAKKSYEAQAGSSLYPQLSANTGASRQRINKAAFGQPGSSSTYNLFNAGVGIGYNLDLFGGNRRLLESLAAETEHKKYQLETARLVLASNLLTTAIKQAQLAMQLEANRKILLAREEQLEITKKRFALGAGSQSEILALQTTVEQSRANIPQVRNSLEQQNHLLAVLAGYPPGSANIPSFTLSDFTLPTSLPVMIASDLVRQRPDIRASEALLQAANAQYGLAISKRYPQINLSADMGSQAITAASLFGPGTLVWGLAGQITQPLFKKGLIAESEAAKAGFDAAEENYRLTVLHAFQNVADVLRSLDNGARTLAAQSAANAASQESLQLVREEYNLGAASYLEVLSADQQVQLNSLNLIAAQADRLINTTALYQAMGGQTRLPVQATPYSFDTPVVIVSE